MDMVGFLQAQTSSSLHGLHKRTVMRMVSRISTDPTVRREVYCMIDSKVCVFVAGQMQTTEFLGMILAELVPNGKSTRRRRGACRIVRFVSDDCCVVLLARMGDLDS